MTPCHIEQVLWPFLKCQYLFSKYLFIFSSYIFKSKGAIVIMLSDLVHDRGCCQIWSTWFFSWCCSTWLNLVSMSYFFEFLLMICYQGYFCPMFSWEDCSGVWYLLLIWCKGHWPSKALTWLLNLVLRKDPLTSMSKVKFILKCVESKIGNQIGHKWWTITQEIIMVKQENHGWKKKSARNRSF